ncbi:MAG TPA: endonuclease/exonuclease/phosphatase family protein [Candidatus Binataceae bacterium]|nr:endonuclease/exonuclease/phosphatase family protein [Candidatus Binataceae bacterium]
MPSSDIRGNGAVSLTMLSWNIHGLPWPLSKDPAGRIDRVCAKIRELSPEIIAMQEAWRAPVAERVAAALKPEWVPFSITNSSGHPRGGLSLFIRARNEWKATGTPAFHPYETSAPVWKFWQGDGLSDKGVLVLEVERNGTRMFVIDTHLQAQYRGSDYAAVRQSQLAQLRRVVSRLDSNLPLLIAGDLNTECREPLYSAITALGTDLTASGRAQNDHYWSNFDMIDRKRVWIDYIVAGNSEAWSASAEMTVIENEGIDHPYSDHNGVFCRIALTPRK